MGKLEPVVISRVTKTDDVPVPLKIHVVIRTEMVPVGITKEVHKPGMKDSSLFGRMLTIRKPLRSSAM